MSGSDDVDVAAFQAKVLHEIRALQSMVEIKSEHLRAAAGEGPAKESGVVPNLIYGFTLRMSHKLLRDMKEMKKIDELNLQVRAFLKERETKEMLCDALRRVDGNLSKLSVRDTRHDAEEIASAIMPLLFPIARGQSGKLSLDPVAFALCAWILARTNVKTYCAEFNEADPLSL